MNMDFGANKTPIEVIKVGAFRDIILLLMVNGTGNHGKDLMN